MPNFLQNLAHAAQQKAQQVYHNAVAPHPAPVTSNTMAPQAQAQIQNARYGVLANNPTLQRNFIQSTNAPKFNALAATPGAFGNAVNTTARGIGAAVTNTAQVPYSAGRVVSANLTGNQKALGNAHKALTSDTANNMVWNDAYRQTSNELAGAIRNNQTLNHLVGHQTDLEKNHAANVSLGNTIAGAYGNSPRAQLYGGLISSANDQNDIARTLGDVGLTPTTSRLKSALQLGAPIVSAGAQTALQATGAGAGEKAVASAALAKQTSKEAGKKLLKTAAGYGTANAGIGMLSPLAQGDTNAMDYLKAGGAGFATGAAMPVLGAGAAKAAPVGKFINKEVQASYAKRGTANAYDATLNDLYSQKKALENRIKNSTNYRGIETTRQHIDQIDAQIAHTIANKPKLSLKDKVLAPNVGLTVGGPNASKFYLAKKQGKVFEGVDGKPRFEIDDSKATFHKAKVFRYDEALNKARQTNAEDYKLLNAYQDLPRTQGLDTQSKHIEAIAKYMPPEQASVFKQRYGMVAKAQTDYKNAIKTNSPNIKEIEDRYDSAFNDFREVDPRTSKNPANLTYKLSDYLNHNELYKQYPDLKDVKIKFQDLPANNGAYTMPNGNTIVVNRRLPPEKGRETLLHEVQHVIQDKEGFATGSSPDIAGSFDHYHKNAAEAEARAVAARRDLPMSERYVKSEPSYKSLAADGIHKQPTLSNQQLENLSREAIDGLKQQGFKGVSNGKRTVRFDEKPATPDYAMSHRPTEGPRAFDLTERRPEMDSWAPKDMYDRWYGSNGTPSDKESIAALKAIKGNPDANVTIYRASPKGDFNHGDWVTLSKKYAETHAEGNGVKVHSQVVKAKDLKWAMDDVNEFGYYPESKPVSKPATSLRSTFYDSLDVPKEDLIIKHDSGMAMSVEKPTASKSKPKEVPPKPSGKRQLPASRGTGGVSSSSRSSLTPKRVRTGIQESVNPKPLKPEVVASLPKKNTTEVKLNTKRLNTPDTAHFDAQTKATVEKMSNKQVEQIAKSAGIDAKSNSIQQTRQQIAEHLNVRSNALRLQQEAETARKAGDSERAASLLKQSADMGRTSREQGTDLARQLQARRIIANELDTPQQRIFKLLDQAGVHPDTYTKRLAEVDFTKPQDVIKAYREMVPPKFSDWLDKYRYSNMLSSPMTQEVNFTGNLEGGMIVRPTQKLFEGGVDAVHSLVTGAPRTRLAGEAGSYLKGYAKSIPAGFRAFGDALSGKSMIDNPDFGDLAHAPLATSGFKGAADKVLSFIPKLMEAGDEAFQATIKGAETRALKYRESKGITVSDIPGRAQEAADYTLFRQKLNNASEGHFLNAVDFIPSKVNEARSSKNPIVRNASKLIYPFVKTGTNISKQMIEYSPLGVATAPGHADKTGQIAKAIMGSTLTGVAAGYLATTDRLTFAAPTDAKEKQKFLAQGKQAYSVKIGNKWVSYQRQHPALAFQLASVAAVHEALKNKKIDQSTADATLTGLASISRFFIDQSYFKNSQDFLNNVSGTGSVGQQAVTALASQGSNIANQFVPFRAAQTWLNNFMDQVQRQPDSSASAFDQFKQQFESQLPGFSKNVPARTDNLGNPLKKPLPVLNNFSPAKISPEKSDNNPKLDALTNEVDRLARQDNGIALTKQPATQTIAGTDIRLNPKQTKSLNEAVNNQVKGGWNQLIAAPQYKSLNDEDKRNALKNLKTDETSAAKRQFGVSNGIELKKNPTKAETAILNGSLDVSTYAKPKNSDGTYSTKAKSTIPTMPKNPHPMPKTIVTTYDEKTKTWTQKSTKTGRTTVISADGTRTLVDPGTKTASSSKSTKSTSSKGTLGVGKKGGFKAYKSNLSGAIAAAKGTSISPSKYKVAKVSLSGKLGSNNKMQKYKQPNLRKRVA